MFGLFKRRETTSVTNITIVNDESDLLFDALEDAHEARVTELLEHNNAQLEENRQLKRILKEAARAVGQSDLGYAREVLSAYA